MRDRSPPAPLLRAGLDVGCDVSADMVALCRERAEREGFSPTLLVQPMHELAPPRRYRTIFVCGGFGLGSTREHDRQALLRFREQLEPGETLVLDNEVPYADERQWRRWIKGGRAGLPHAWRGPPTERRRSSDGNEYALQSRLVDLDPLEQRLTMQMRAYMWRDGVLAAQEEHTIDINLYFTQELVLLLERAGFTDVVLHGDHRPEPPTAESDFVVFVAR